MFVGPLTVAGKVARFFVSSLVYSELERQKLLKKTYREGVIAAFVGKLSN